MEVSEELLRELARGFAELRAEAREMTRMADAISDRISRALRESGDRAEARRREYLRVGIVLPPVRRYDCEREWDGQARTPV